MRKLILSVTMDDCEMQVFRAGGNGGQHQNKTSSGVRIIHKASGARGEAREERSQLQNKKLAFNRMANSVIFRTWLARELMSESAEERVEKDMAPKNLKVEVKQDGKWVEDGNN